MRGSTTEISEVTAMQEPDSDGRNDETWRFQWPIEALAPEVFESAGLSGQRIEMELRAVRLSDGNVATRRIQVIIHP